MSEETKVAPAGSASQKPAKAKAEKTTATENKGGGKTQKKVKYTNPFSFSDPLQTKFVNCIMKNGKKNLAQKILKDTFDEMNRKGDVNPGKSFEMAMRNATPMMEVRAKRIGGAVYQIPIEVTTNRQQSLSIRWILQGARKKKGMPMFKRLAGELTDCANETGFAFGKREDSHKMAQSNKAFAHLARY